ncbi:MAG: hypothetical protein QXU40_02145, partial [Candidatus Pacearchaeota archaeon]
PIVKLQVSDGSDPGIVSKFTRGNMGFIKMMGGWEGGALFYYPNLYIFPANNQENIDVTNIFGRENKGVFINGTTGNVGIGTNSPLARFEVKSLNRNREGIDTLPFRIQTYDINYSLDIQPYVIESGNYGYNLSTRNNNTIKHNLLLDSRGNVKIGGDLSVVGNINGDLSVVGNINGDGNLNIINGRVGIGTNSPQERLDIVGDIQIRNGGAGDAGSIVFMGERGYNDGLIIWTRGDFGDGQFAGSIALRPRGASGLTILSNISGNYVGIRKENPIYDLDVLGIIRATQGFYVGNYNGVGKPGITRNISVRGRNNLDCSLEIVGGIITNASGDGCP